MFHVCRYVYVQTIASRGNESVSRLVQYPKRDLKSLGKELNASFPIAGRVTLV